MITGKNIIGTIKSSLGVYKQADAELIFQTCPFCRDTKYHFYFHPQKRVFHCFKCGASGGLYTLTRELGLRLEGNPMDIRTQEIKEVAADYFAEQLLRSSRAEEAKAWLCERGIDEKWPSVFETSDEKIPKRLPVGFHPGDGEMVKHMEERGYGREDLVQAGILLGNFMDFVNSVVFVYHLSPYRIGRFKVRKVRGSSSDTVWLGQKGTPTGVFGLQLCSWPKTEKHKEVICVEGEFDALALYLLALRSGDAR